MGTKISNKAILNQILELTDSLSKGDYSNRMIVDADDSTISKIAGNLNNLSDQLTINSPKGNKNNYQNIGQFGVKKS